MPFSIYQLLAACLVVSLASTLMGFKKTVWFISLGYATAIVAMTFVLVLFFYPTFQYFHWFQCISLVIWGARLGVFLYQREHNEHYRNAVKHTIAGSQNLPFLSKATVWIAVSALYVCLFAPALFTAVNPTLQGLAIIPGIMTMLVGLYLEAMADHEKSAFKAANPDTFCNVGLYKTVRSPNYLGEILFWTGNFIVGIPFFTAWWCWALSGIGLICIILIMIGSTKRLEAKQLKTYGADPAFQTYIKTVPVLFPWLPIYTLKDVKVYLE